jgi:probable HAF family extracellular repeat protein
VNSHGLVVGLHTPGPAGPSLAYVWSRRDGLAILDTGGGDPPNTFAAAINDCGVIVGSAHTPSSPGGSHAVRWVHGELEDLGTLGGPLSGAADVNERGHIVGAATIASGSTRAFLWTPEEGMRSLGTLGGSFSNAEALNNHDEVVGLSETAAGEIHGFIWSGRTGMVDLGTRGEQESRAVDINDRGEVVFVASGDLGNIARGFKWTRKGGFVELRDLAGGPGFTFAHAINNRGIIAGEVKNVNGDRRAVLWLRPHQIVAIDPQSGEIASRASGISDRWVAGVLTLNDLNDEHGVAWRLRPGVIDSNHERQLRRLCRKSAHEGN